MILPDKNINTAGSLLGVGAILIKSIKKGQTVSSLWEKTTQVGSSITFDKFILVLDLLYGLTAISYQDGIIRLTNDS
jgi:hypothetical protein